MNYLIAKFKNSTKELSTLQGLTICGMLLALRVVLGYFSNISLSITPNAKVGFSFLPIALAGVLTGPVGAMIVGGLGDLISYFLMPMGGYFFGWTLNGILVGLLYGLLLYDYEKHFLLRIIIAEVLIGLLVEIPLGSLWLLIQFDKAFWVMAGTRGIKTLIAIPIETILILFFGSLLRKIPYLKPKSHK